MMNSVSSDARAYRRKWAVSVAISMVVLFATIPLSSANATVIPDVEGIDVDFRASGNTLSGTLFLPQGEGPFPAVVFLAGSGDESYRTGWEGESRSWFWPELQAWFAAQGHAVYIFDKPGVGDSEGDWRSEDFGDRANNTLTAVQALASRADIDGSRIGLLGHSQGGWIAVKAAANSVQSVAYVISLAGPAISVRQQIMEDTTNRWHCEELRFQRLRQAGLSMMLSSLSGIGRILPAGYLSGIVRYDPSDDLAKMKQPLLALFSSNDIMVMPETNVTRLERHFGRNSGNRKLVIETIPGLDHFFREGEFCLGGPRPQTFHSGFWEALAAPSFWVMVNDSL